MRACVFVGPTLPQAEARAELDAVYLPPVRQGDLYRAVSLLRPCAVGIIDGSFQWTPAVWHKEILWALMQGVQVFGASSMGALRAVELEAHGMRGVGRVFEAYRDGCLAEEGGAPFEDDDEVAVVYGPAELGYPLVSEAMINIRVTLIQAVRHGVVTEATGKRLCGIAKAAFFPQRSYATVLAEARLQRLPEAELSAFERWLPTGGIDQKRIDARALLRTMRAWISADKPPAPLGFIFENTCYWHQSVERFEAGPTLDGDDALVLAELRLDPHAWRATFDRVVDRLAGPEREAESTEPAALLAAARLRKSRAAVLDHLPAAVIERQMLEELKVDGLLARLRASAEAKRRFLTEAPADFESLSEHQRLELTDWFFTKVVGSEIPDDMDVWIKEAGYAEEAAFHAAIFDEFRFRRSRKATPRRSRRVPREP